VRGADCARQSAAYVGAGCFSAYEYVSFPGAPKVDVARRTTAHVSPAVQVVDSQEIASFRSFAAGSGRRTAELRSCLSPRRRQGQSCGLAAVVRQLRVELGCGTNLEVGV
jgi:hypothetical protein